MVELHTISGDIVYVNPKHVAYFKSKSGMTIVTFRNMGSVGYSVIKVVERVDVVAQKFEEYYDKKRPQ